MKGEAYPRSGVTQPSLAGPWGRKAPILREDSELGLLDLLVWGKGKLPGYFASFLSSKNIFFCTQVVQTRSFKSSKCVKLHIMQIIKVPLPEPSPPRGNHS